MIPLTKNSHSLLVSESGIVYRSIENSPASSKLSTISIRAKKLKEGTRKQGLPCPKLTLNVTPYICLGTLALVDHLNDLEQVLLLKLLQRLGDLLVVVFLASLLTAYAAKTLLLRSVLVVGQGPGLAQLLLQRLGGVLEGDAVCGRVLLLLEVEVLDDGGELGLLGRVEVDDDFEFAPSLVAAEEWRIREGCVFGRECQRSSVAARRA
jgi:hypothetical protein